MSGTTSASTHKKPNRKRKKSFLKNARKYGKKGCYGRGSQLDADTYQYFVRILEVYREGFETDEDKTNFASNVFEQTVEQEISCCCNQIGCRVIEMLLPFANDAVLERFMNVLSAELRPLCSDRFASHVLEALVRQAGKKSFFKSEDNNEIFMHSKEFVIKVSKFLLNNLEDYLWDTYGSHVIRTCLETLAHIPKESKQKNVKVEEIADLEILSEYKEIIKDYAERVMHWPQFNELCNSETSSGFLQVLLKALKKSDKSTLKTLLDKLISSNFTSENSGDNVPAIFLSIPAMMVLEASIDVAKKKQFTEIYLKCFTGRSLKLATTRSTNFAIQKLIQKCKEKSVFDDIFDELSSHFDEIIKVGHTGIIWSLAQGCKKFATKQGTFMQNLMKSLGCFEEDKHSAFILCLCKFAKFDEHSPKTNLQKEKLNLHGTLTLQLLLEFNKPIKVVNGLLNMEQSELLGLLSNTMGSHIVDSYVKSTFVGEKSREKLVRKMMGVYQELASSKYGSRSFDALWNAASLKYKITIMEELSKKEGAWSNSEFGKIIASKVNLVLFKRNKEQWKNSLNTLNKARELFADIVK